MTKYIYKVDGNSHNLRVEVGVHDPQRWAASVERGETKQAAGMSFGETAGVDVSQRWDSSLATVAANRETPSFNAKVTMGAIGAHDTETARRRISVYTQATDIAVFINDALAAGDSLEAITTWLGTNLRQDPDNPAEGPFVYKGDIGLYPQIGV